MKKYRKTSINELPNISRKAYLKVVKDAVKAKALQLKTDVDSLISVESLQDVLWDMDINLTHEEIINLIKN